MSYYYKTWGNDKCTEHGHAFISFGVPTSFGDRLPLSTRCVCGSKTWADMLRNDRYSDPQMDTPIKLSPAALRVRVEE